MFKKLVPLFCIVIMASSACGTLSGNLDSMPTPLPDPPSPAVVWQTYQNARYKFSITYPPDATVLVTDDEHARINLSIAAWTNLSSKSVEITVVPGSHTCPSQYGALGSSETITVRGMTFLHESGLGVATGNIYDWESYSTTKDNNCVNLTFVLHSSDIGNYMTPPTEFDRAKETKIFPSIFATFTW